MNSQIKKGLGRGLSSLIGETRVESKTNKLPLSDIVPNKFQTDINGRIYNCKNIHILDSSILPSIPAKPLTFITILNALRITNNLFNN